MSKEEVPSKLEIQCKTSVHFSFNFGWRSIQLDILLKMGDLLNRQNLLSVTKAICQHSPSVFSDMVLCMV